MLTLPASRLHSCWAYLPETSDLESATASFMCTDTGPTLGLEATAAPTGLLLSHGTPLRSPECLPGSSGSISAAPLRAVLASQPARYSSRLPPLGHCCRAALLAGPLTLWCSVCLLNCRTPQRQVTRQVTCSHRPSSLVLSNRGTLRHVAEGRGEPGPWSPVLLGAPTVRWSRAVRSGLQLNSSLGSLLLASELLEKKNVVFYVNVL